MKLHVEEDTHKESVITGSEEHVNAIEMTPFYKLLIN